MFIELTHDTFVSVDITVSVVAGSTIGNHRDAHILNHGPTIRYQNVTLMCTIVH